VAAMCGFSVRTFLLRQLLQFINSLGSLAERRGGSRSMLICGRDIMLNAMGVNLTRLHGHR
jgi:hypothetical protein